MDKKIYQGIDVGKLFASVLVVLLHAVETTAWTPAGVKFVFTRFAVPFFFITSGFFFYKGLSNASNHKKYFVKYEKNLVKILVIWELVYLPFVVSSYLKNNPDKSFIHIIGLLFRRLVVIGAGPYWYLVALIWSAAFLYICFRWNDKTLLFGGIIFGLGLEIAYSCFKGFFSNSSLFQKLFRLIYVVWSYEFNFLMFGIPFMGIGYLIARNRITLPKRLCILFFSLGTALRMIEYELPHIIPGEFWIDNCISLAFILQAISFFLWMKEWEPLISKSKSIIFRQLSSCIFYTHAIFLYEILDPFLDKYTSMPTYEGSMVLPKVFITLLMCLLFFIIVKKINNKHLNILING